MYTVISLTAIYNSLILSSDLYAPNVFSENRGCHHERGGVPPTDKGRCPRTDFERNVNGNTYVLLRNRILYKYMVMLSRDID